MLNQQRRFITKMPSCSHILVGIIAKNIAMMNAQAKFRTPPVIDKHNT